MGNHLKIISSGLGRRDKGLRMLLICAALWLTIHRMCQWHHSCFSASQVLCYYTWQMATVVDMLRLHTVCCMESYIHPDHLQGFCGQFLVWRIWCELGICISDWSPADGNAAGPRTTLGESLLMTLPELVALWMAKTDPQLGLTFPHLISRSRNLSALSDTRLWKIGGLFFFQPIVF